MGCARGPPRRTGEPTGPPAGAVRRSANVSLPLADKKTSSSLLQLTTIARPVRVRKQHKIKAVFSQAPCPPRPIPPGAGKLRVSDARTGMTTMHG